jgi:CBS domain-containing protein
MPPPNFILVLIAFFIFMAASQEGLQADIKTRLKNFYVRDVLPESFITVTPQTPLREVLGLSMRSHQSDYPVVENGRLVGLLLRSDIIAAMRKSGSQGIVGEIMRRNFPVIEPDAFLLNARKLMEKAGIKALPVARGESLLGIVTLEEISRVYTLISRG